jgi:uncharacterized protein YyaL (SSP411 family)
MAAPGGGFYAALDADSEGEEGRFYVWDPEELDRVLGPKLSREIRAAYNITPEGNFENGKSNPALVEPDFARREALATARVTLRQHREKNRTAPGRDPKISLAWNALMIRALAEAGFYFNQPAWLQRARAAADFIWEHLRPEGESFRLHSVYYENAGSSVEAFLHDYALAAEAFLALAAKIDWLDAGASATYRQRAQTCIDKALTDFVDPQAPGFYFTAEGVETPVTRRKEWFDNAQPSGNSTLLHALSAFHALTGESRYAEALQACRPVYAEYAARVASGVAHGLEALAAESRGIAHIKAGPAADLEALRVALLEHPHHRIFIESVPALQGASDSAAQLCLNHTCHPPQENPTKILAPLGSS